MVNTPNYCTHSLYQLFYVNDVRQELRYVRGAVKEKERLIFVCVGRKRAFVSLQLARAGLPVLLRHVDLGENLREVAILLTNERDQCVARGRACWWGGGLQVDGGDLSLG